MRIKSCGSIHRQNQSLCDSKVLLRGAMNIFLAYMGVAVWYGDWIINSNNNSTCHRAPCDFAPQKSFIQGRMDSALNYVHDYLWLHYIRNRFSSVSYENGFL